MKALWEKFGSKKLLVILLTLAGYVAGAVPQDVLDTSLLAYFGSQAVGDVASSLAARAKAAVAPVLKSDDEEES